jgi:RND family efflux transporter MFP subunit
VTARGAVIVPLLLAGLTLGGCGRRTAPKPMTSDPPPLPADVQKLVPPAPAAAPAAPGATGTDGSPEVAHEAEGKLVVTGELASPVRSELSPRLPGRVGKVLVDEGARVRKDQPLLELESEYFRLDVARAKAELARANAVAADAAADLRRKTELLAKGSVTQAVSDRSKTTGEQAEAAKLSAQAALDTAEQRLADAVLRSPLDGVVAERRADVGERLAENTVAFVLVQTAPLKLRFKLPERYVATVKAGQPVRAFVDPYPGEAFTGKVSVTVAAIDPASRSFIVDAEFPNRDGRLHPGLFARVELILPRAASAR